MRSTKSFSVSKQILLLGAWFGLVTGLIEGLVLYIFHQQGWLRGQITFLGSSVEALWASPLIDLILFLLAASGLALLGWAIPRLPILQVAIFAFSLLMIFDWISLLLMGRIALFALVLLATGVAIQVTRMTIKSFERFQNLVQRSLPWVIGLVLAAFVFIQGGSWLVEQISVYRLPVASTDSLNNLVLLVPPLSDKHE